MGYFTEDIKPQNFKNQHKENYEKACQDLASKISQEMKNHFKNRSSMSFDTSAFFEYDRQAIETVTKELTERGFKVSTQDRPHDQRDGDRDPQIVVITVKLPENH
jgi:hypothetical protein